MMAEVAVANPQHQDPGTLPQANLPPTKKEETREVMVEAAAASHQHQDPRSRQETNLPLTKKEETREVMVQVAAANPQQQRPLRMDQQVNPQVKKEAKVMDNFRKKEPSSLQLRLYLLLYQCRHTHLWVF